MIIMKYSANSQSNTNGGKSAEIKFKITIDRFLKDKTIPQLAKDLYQEKVKPTDNFGNIALIDSLNSTGYARGFYFLVITKTMKSSDGAYAEPLGIAAKEFVEKNTNEFVSYFINNPGLLCTDDLKNWASFVYSEIQISSEGSEQKAINDFKIKIRKNCKRLSKRHIKKANEFIELIK